MLPKVSFTDDAKEENGSKMLSRFGKMTRFNYPVFYGVDPVSQHAQFLKNIDKKDPNNIDHETIAKEEEMRNIKARDNSMESKTDLDGFIRRMNQQKALVFTKKAMPSSKISSVKKPHLEESRAQALESYDSMGGEHHNFSSIQTKPTSDIEEVDIDAQIEAAKALLKNIRMRNQTDHSTVQAGGGDAAANTEE